MIQGHGDDLQNYPYGSILYNMSSNVLAHVNHEGLFNYMANNLYQISHYPSPTPLKLEEKLAERHGIMPSQVCATNGATEAIYLVAQCHTNQISTILQPTFAEYEDACRMHHHRIKNVLKLPEGKFSEPVDICWLCNPGNPTGNVIEKEKLISFIAKNSKTLFVIDQSYEHFTNMELLSCKEAIDMGNVVLLHSMTKQFSVPGLRIGYVTGAENMIEILKKLRLPWSMGQMSQLAGIYLLENEKTYNFDVEALMQERKRLYKALEITKVVEMWPSQSHILLCMLRTGNAKQLKEYLVSKYGLLIRDASNFHGLNSQYFRIAVQDRQVNDVFINAFYNWLQE